MDFLEGLGMRGFTLIELMIVVAIIAIIAAIAIPNLLESKKSANESSAISTLRTLSSVQAQYVTRFDTYANLATLCNASLIDSVLGAGTKSGYTFTCSFSGNSCWACTAAPTTAGTTGDRSFQILTDGVIKYDPAGGTSYTVVVGGS
jgi:prepilin-type N-terminal cleavage/methylation domain-containing protein